MGKPRCENCRHWKVPDPFHAIANRGVCTALAGGSVLKAPFWSTKLTSLTLSWEGEHCASFMGNKSHG